MIENWNKLKTSYRSKLFWAWNDDIKPEKIAEQISQMKAMGLGGFYIHSRNGLKTPYLQKPWFDMVNFAISTANKANLEPCLYDEDRWPSGACGGLIAEKYPHLRAQMLLCKNGGTKPENTIYTYNKDNETKYFYTQYHTPTEWFNNSTYPDVFQRETAKRFIKLTHEKYLANCGNFKENNISEIFMDEPYYGVECFRFGQPLPWTPKLPRLYKELYNEDLYEQIPGLFFNLEDSSHIKIRWQFHSLLSKLFRENFLQPIYQWCEEHNIKLTGHLIGEDTLGMQCSSSGSNMAALEYFQNPGVDCLTGQRRIPETIKQLSSIANQLDKKTRLAEIYGCTGWDFSLYEQRRQGDMLFALGINKHCLHLGWYSTLGERKRDFPGSLAWHSSTTSQYAKLEDRFARLHAIFEQCQEDRKILVINPTESAYTLLQEQYEETFTMESLENSRREIVDILLNANLDFDFGDEEIIKKYGSVANNLFTIGKVSYQAIVIPETITLRKNTWKLLKEFYANGGIIYFSGTIPSYLDGKEEIKDFDFPTCNPSDLPEKLSSVRVITLTDKNNQQVSGLLHLLLKNSDGYFLFIHNLGYSNFEQLNSTNWRGTPIDERNTNIENIKVNISYSYKNIQEWNMDNGEIYAARNTFSLKAGESKLLFFTNEYIPVSQPPIPLKNTIQIMDSVFPVNLTEPNVMLLDRPEYQDNNGKYHHPCNIRRIDAAIRKNNNMAQRQLPRRQPWADKTVTNKIPVKLRYTFFCQEIPQTPVVFGCEDANAKVYTNNTISPKTDYFWFDNSLKFYQITNIQLGINHIVLDTYIDYYQTLEDCYLLGDFGVKIDGFNLSMTSKITQLNFGNWCDQGLPFYSGSVDYKIKVTPNTSGKLNVKIKASYAKILDLENSNWCEAYNLKIPNNTNEFTLRLYGSRKNSHGPFHTQLQLKYYNPSCFNPIRETFHPLWQLTEYGIFKLDEK